MLGQEAAEERLLRLSRWLQRGMQAFPLMATHSSGLDRLSHALLGAPPRLPVVGPSSFSGGLSAGSWGGRRCTIQVSFHERVHASLR